MHQAIEVDRITRETGAGEEGFEPDTRLMAALGRTFRAVELQAADERRREHIAALAAFHAHHDLLLTPTLGEPPIRIGSLDLPARLRALTEGLLRARATGLLRLGGILDQVVERNLAWVPYTQLANITGRPAISLPLHQHRRRAPDGGPVRRPAGQRRPAAATRTPARARHARGRSTCRSNVLRWEGIRPPWPEGLEGFDTARDTPGRGNSWRRPAAAVDIEPHQGDSITGELMQKAW